MSEYTRISKSLVIEDDVVDSYRGETYGTIKIGNPTTGVAYGYINYSIFRGMLNPASARPRFGYIFHIKMIEVHEGHKRKGYASKMLAYVKKHYRGYKIDTGMTTPDGAKLFRRKVKARR